MAPRILDISQPLGVATAVWPGDRAVELDWTMSRRRGDTVNVAGLTLTVHAGTHADGPLHYADVAPAIGDVPLDAYIGSALVVDARGASVIDERALHGVALDGVERILFHTRAAVDPTRFPAQFAAIAPDLAQRLGDAGVKLIGTDAPSVDPFDSKTLDAHHALAAHGIAILENLLLDDVAAGVYQLVALPLRLAEADSSPVRAVLLQNSAP